MEGNPISKFVFDLHNRFLQRRKRSWLILGPDELERIRSRTFAIVGIGGVGTIATELLARYGVRRIRLLDLDRYSESNMMRQLFALPSTLGRPKAEVAAERILEINPKAEIELKLVDRVTQANAEKLLTGADILIQTADTPSALLLYRMARAMQKPLINGYCENGRCYVQVFDYRTRKCKTWVESLKDYIKWHKEKDILEMTPEEREALDTTQYHYEQPCPPLNFVTNTTGCLLVAEAVKLILGKGRVAHYPKRINLDILSLKMKMDNPYSLFKLENYFRLLTMLKGKAHIRKIQRQALPE